MAWYTWYPVDWFMPLHSGLAVGIKVHDHNRHVTSQGRYNPTHQTPQHPTTHSATLPSAYAALAAPQHHGAGVAFCKASSTHCTCKMHAVLNQRANVGTAHTRWCVDWLKLVVQSDHAAVAMRNMQQRVAAWEATCRAAQSLHQEKKATTT